jgi:hypothetical protein
LILNQHVGFAAICAPKRDDPFWPEAAIADSSRLRISNLLLLEPVPKDDMPDLLKNRGRFDGAGAMSAAPATSSARLRSGILPGG